MGRQRDTAPANDPDRAARGADAAAVRGGGGMTPRDAAAVFAQFGVSAGELASQPGIRAARNRLMKAKHTDHGESDTAAAALINAAYDVLKQLPEGYYEAALPASAPPPPGLPGGFYDRQMHAAGVPRWQTDRTSTANTVIDESYSDANYIKRRLWELSGCGNDEYELFYYDGSFRRSIRVFGAPEIYPEMAKAVIAWNGGARGFGHRVVFVRRRRDARLFLIHMNGRDLGRPRAVRQDSFDLPLGSDHQFLQQLPGLLAEVVRNFANYA